MTNSIKPAFTFDPNAFYEAKELKELLHGHVSLETLRQRGLVNLRKMYWGQNIIDSMNCYCKDREQKQGVLAGKEVKDIASTHKAQISLGNSVRGDPGSMESSVDRFRRSVQASKI